MDSRSHWKFGALCAAALFATSMSSANALPADPCNVKPVPAKVGDGSVSIALPNKQPARGWQRQGGPIEITVTSPNIPPNATMVVCFQWKLKDTNAPADEKYKKFVASGTATGSIPADKPKTLIINTSVPTELPEKPNSPNVANDGRPVGVYALNNQFPVADVRVLLYGAGDVPVVDLTAPFGVVGVDVYCDMPLTGTNVDSGIGSIGEHKRWQPIDGEFEFNIKSNKVIPANAPVFVCFRWKLERGDPRRFYDSGPTRITDRQPMAIKIAATVSRIEDLPAWWPADSKDKSVEPRVGAYAIPIIGLVPLADVRILIVDNDGTPIVDVRTAVGITNLYFAWFITILTVICAFYILLRVCRRRLDPPPKCSALLCTITTRRGYASLSQFQIILWTFVVIASAVYVMTLSGDLIQITSGTLVLLGISGSALVLSKAKSEAEAATAPQPVDPVQAAAAADVAEAEAKRLRDAVSTAPAAAKEDADSAATEATALAAAARAKAVAAQAVADAAAKRKAADGADTAGKQTAESDAKAAETAANAARKDAIVTAELARKATRQRHPAWSDLVMEEVQGRELDVTRIQMLYFTLVTAGFVLLTVVTSYAIPVIPEGFLVLMGISNSVYVGSKFATNAAAK